MAGNTYEWTTENCTLNENKYIVVRGGIYNGSGSDYPVSLRNGARDNAAIYFALRVVLYK